MPSGAGWTRRVLTAARRAPLRTVFLLIGAAIFFGFTAVDFGLAQVLWEAWPGPVAVLLLVVLVVAPPSLLALVPGIRELEVQASSFLLSPSTELSTSSSRDRATITRTGAFVIAHMVLGGIAGTILVVGLPWVVVWAGGHPVGEGAVAGLGALVLAVVLVVTGLACVVVLGAAVATLASGLLGPSANDRLMLAEQRLREEQEHRRLARDLHDGIGHALSIISLQATAGRQVLARDPARAEEALETVLRTAQDAMAELDEMIRVLRDDAPERRGATLADLSELVESYRATGMRVTADLDDLPGLPAFASREAFRIVQEALSNSRRHGSGARADLSVRVASGAVVIEVRNPSGPASSEAGVGGHGLAGLRERVEVFGGQLSAGRSRDEWRLRAELPLGVG